jgi:hypothetical protein
MKAQTEEDVADDSEIVRDIRERFKAAPARGEAMIESLRKQVREGKRGQKPKREES